MFLSRPSGRKLFRFLSRRDIFQEAAEAARYAVFTGEHLLVEAEHLDLGKGLPTLDRSAEEALLLHVRDGNTDRVMEGVERFVENVRQLGLSPDALRHECLALVFRILRVSDETGRDYLSEKGSDCLPHVRLATLRDEHQVLSWVTDMAGDIARWMASVRAAGGHRSINRVADYLRSSYAKSVTLKQLGDLVHMNPSYLCVLFKREMGMTYLSYLTNLRMDHAKALLDGGLRTWEAGRSVGYYNYRHFAKLFRRHLGMTPAEYRSQRRRAPHALDKAPTPG
jgi:two-component system response regulator YesN